MLTGGGGFPRRSGLAVACAVLGLLAMLVLFAVLFSGTAWWLPALAAPVVALASLVCALLALFRDWGRARVGVVLVLVGDVLVGAVAAAMVTQTVVAVPLAAACLVVLVGVQVVGAILVLTAPRKGQSSTPRAVEPSWSGPGPSGGELSGPTA